MNISTYFRKKSIDNINQCALEDTHYNSLAKHLGVRDLTSLGIAAIIGAGIFTTIGQASADGGPALQRSGGHAAAPPGLPGTGVGRGEHAARHPGVYQVDGLA